MPELESIASPLGAECDPEDTLADILEVLRLQDPVPLVVVRGDDVLGTIGLEAVVSSFDAARPDERPRRHASRAARSTSASASSAARR